MSYSELESVVGGIFTGFCSTVYIPESRDSSGK